MEWPGTLLDIEPIMENAGIVGIVLLFWFAFFAGWGSYVAIENGRYSRQHFQGGA
jgi:hypothetical protein